MAISSTDNPSQSSDELCYLNNTLETCLYSSESTADLCLDLLVAPPKLTSNADISGIGVIIAFLGTAYITFGILVLHFILVFDPKKSGLIDERKTHRNPLDSQVVGWMPKVLRRSPARWESALEKIVLTMSDQQMITGPALLCSVFIQIQDISSYHWQIAIYLVWFTSFTHIATLTLLRRYFQRNQHMRRWRLFIMFIIVGMLIAVLVPTGNSAWPTNAREMSVPARCFYDFSDISIGSYNNSDIDTDTTTVENNVTVINRGLRFAKRSYRKKYRTKVDPDESPLYTMIFAALLLVISYVTRAIKLFHRSSEMARTYLRSVPNAFLKNILQVVYQDIGRASKRRWIFSMPYWSLLAGMLLVRAWVDIFDSMVWEILWLLFALLWGTFRLFSTRNLIPAAVTAEENKWAFGQCLAVAMLFLTFFTMFEIYSEPELEAVSPKTEGVIAEEPSTEAALSATLMPHEENFYQFTWFRFLQLLIILQVVTAASFILPGFYNSDLGPFDVSDILDLGLNLLTWAIFYAHLSTCLFFIPFLVSFAYRDTHPWSWISRLRRLNDKFWHGRLSMLLMFATALFFNAALLLGKPFPLEWEDAFNGLGQILTGFYPITLIILVAIPWSVVIWAKRKRRMRNAV